METTFKLSEESRKDMLLLRKKIIGNSHHLIDDISLELYSLGVSKFIKNKLGGQVDMVDIENHDLYNSEYENYVGKPCKVLDDIWLIPRTKYNMSKNKKRLFSSIRDEKEKFKWLQIAVVCRKLIEMKDSWDRQHE